MADIFLSYSREDLERARAIERALDASGWTVFWDRELLPGAGFRRAIAHELECSRCVIVLWSRTSIDSEWVIDEAETGRRRGHLVSILIDDVEPPLGFRQVQAADLVRWQGHVEDPAFELLARGVASLAPRSLAGEARPAPEPPSIEPVPARPVAAPRPGSVWIGLTTRHAALAPTLLLGVVFLVNVVETSLDAWLTPAALGAGAGYPIADAFRWFEGAVSFEAHDVTSTIACVGYSLSYFLIFPLLCLSVAWVLARRPDPVQYRAVSLAVTIDYLVSLPFFLFFPVPERWSFPASEAMLLSDKLSEALIEMIRPISGLDNSFPSFHVSLTTLVATACFLFNVPLRTTILALGATVVLATFVLGIHWIPDVLAGSALGIASMLLAWRVARRGRLALVFGPAR
jgi:membrane-associated phospholipid phosphatase